MVNRSRIWGAREEGLGGLEGLQAVVDLEVTTEVSGPIYKYGKTDEESHHKF